MSDAKKCDRCGVLYSPEYFGKYTVKWYYGFGAKELDLCKNCVQKLEQWMENGEKPITKPDYI